MGKKETIGDVRARGARLGLHCRACGRFRYIRPQEPDDTPLPVLRESLRCHRCRSDDVDTVAVDRDPRTGIWPAERS